MRAGLLLGRLLLEPSESVYRRIDGARMRTRNLEKRQQC